MKHFYFNCLMAVLAMVFSVQLHGQTTVYVDNIRYQLNGVEAYVVGYNNAPDSVTIPETITVDGLTFNVTAISESSFKDCYSLKKVKAYYIKSIGESCFENCVFLREVRLLSLKNIGDYAFRNCRSLEIVGLGFKDLDLEYEAFRYCSSLKYLVFGGKVVGRTLGNVCLDCPLLQAIIYLDEKGSSNLGSNAKVYNWDSTNLKSGIFGGFDYKFTYTGKKPQPTYTSPINTPAGFHFTNFDFSKLETDAGDHSDPIEYYLANQDMAFCFGVSYHYTITKANLTATVQNATKEYGDPNPKFEVKYSGFVNGEDEKVLDSPGTFNTTADRKSAVGEYLVSLQGITDNNYNITQNSGILTICKAPLTVKPANKERNYGSKNPQFTLEYEGLKNSETAPEWENYAPSIDCSAKTSSPVGTYDITVSDCEARNYTVSIGRGTLTVSKAPLRITANDISRMYYEPNPDLKCSYYGFVNGENSSVLDSQPQLSTTATLNSKAGKYPINISGAEAQNYSIIYESGVLQVQKRSLNVSAENYTREYNKENPKFAINYKGFANDEDENVLITKPTVTTNATKTSDVGTYSLTVSGGMADNYDFVYSNGSLKIEKAYQTIEWDQSLENIPLYSQVELNAQASSNLEVTYELNNDTVCNLTQIGSKTYLDCFHDGKVVITAYQSGNKNYWPTNKFYKVLTVSEPTGIRTISKDRSLAKRIMSANGYIYVPSLALNETLFIYTQAGQLLYRGHEQSVMTGSGVFIVKIGNKTTKIVVK